MKTVLKITLPLILACSGVSASASDKELAKCQQVQNKIGQLETQRQKGGSARQMDAWKRSLHNWQDEYTRLYCRQYRFKLDKH